MARTSSRRMLWAVSVALLLACKPTTQVSFNITSDIPCDKLSATAITIGLEGETEKGPPSTVVKKCDNTGTVSAIGSYALVPKGGKVSVVASIKVAVAVGSDVDVETDCTSAKQFAGCVVARRRVSFIASRSLSVPVELLLSCKGVACDENSTCNRAGKCVTSKVDTARCDGQGTCSEFETLKNEGVPCFNGDSGDQLFCTGTTSWCTQRLDGQRACAAEPTPGGISFQCRDSSDCGPNLQCVAGVGGVVGKCVLAPGPGETVLCSPAQMNSPCPGGGQYCRADAGNGLFQCDEPPRRWDGGIYEGFPCPRTGELRCYGATPFCDLYEETPRCSADAGAQCWYNSDCPPGQGCFAGTGGSSRMCARPWPPSKTRTRSVTPPLVQLTVLRVWPVTEPSTATACVVTRAPPVEETATA